MLTVTRALKSLDTVIYRFFREESAIHKDECLGSSLGGRKFGMNLFLSFRCLYVFVLAEKVSLFQKLLSAES